MNALLMTAALALGQDVPVAPRPATTVSLDGTYSVVAMEIDGRPATVSPTSNVLAIRNNTLTLPGAAAMHGTLRLEPGPKGALVIVPAAAGTGSRRDTTAGGAGTPGSGTPIAGTSGTGVTGGATGSYVRTADYLTLTIGDPSAATAAGTGTGATGGAGSGGPTTDARAGTGPGGQTSAPAAPSAGAGTLGTVGQPPVVIVLRRAEGADAAAVAPPAGAPTTTMTGTAGPPRRLSTVVGSNVVLSDGSTAGRIEDVMVGSNGAVEYAVIGTNNGLAPVPWSAATFDATGNAIRLGLTAEAFGQVPTFTGNTWATLNDPAFVQRVRTSFGLPQLDPRNNAGLGNRLTNPGNTNVPPTNQPGTQPNQPGTQPNQPGTQPNQPGTQPKTQPGTQPKNQPGTQPKTQPGTQPKQVPPKG